VSLVSHMCCRYSVAVVNGPRTIDGASTEWVIGGQLMNNQGVFVVNLCTRVPGVRAEGRGIEI